MWLMLGKGKFTIVEYGAGAGKLAADILSALQGQVEMYEQLRYCIIEKSPVMVGLEKGSLKKRWNGTLTSLKLKFTSQGEFLLQMCFNNWAMEAFSEEKDVALAARKIAMHRHMLVMDMGCKFKIIFQEKGM